MKHHQQFFIGDINNNHLCIEDVELYDEGVEADPDYHMPRDICYCSSEISKASYGVCDYHLAKPTEDALRYSFNTIFE
jgi:hypothetical protein